MGTVIMGIAIVVEGPLVWGIAVIMEGTPIRGHAVAVLAPSLDAVAVIARCSSGNGVE